MAADKTEHFVLTSIGILHGDLKNRAETPKNYDESEHTGVIEILPRYRQALEGIEVGQTIVVLFWLHRAERDILKVHPRGDTARPLRGVFATRSPDRPNPVAISELQVTGINGLQIAVRGVDVFDGTPIIDIKKRIGERKR
ncbi:MAG: tRNA (N6-threonylcarbamoyladenosine(37)-N6)-methyltransferase TrmO [Deltaproteobacteria bacterium]